MIYNQSDLEEQEHPTTIWDFIIWLLSGCFIVAGILGGLWLFFLL